MTGREQLVRQVAALLGRLSYEDRVAVLRELDTDALEVLELSAGAAG